MREPLIYRIETVKAALPLKGKHWVETNMSELAQKIRYYEAVINYDSNNCDDAREHLVELLYKVLFSKPWEPYISYEVIVEDPPPYISYEVLESPTYNDIISEESEEEWFRFSGGTTIDSGDIIVLPCCGIQLVVNKIKGVGKIIQSHLTDELSDEEDDRFVAAMRAIELMVLNHAIYGIDVCSDDYACGVETAVEDCEDLYG